MTGVAEPDACDVPGGLRGVEYESTLGFTVDACTSTAVPNRFNILQEEWPVYVEWLPPSSGAGLAPNTVAV